jgi:hypothetical protein
MSPHLPRTTLPVAFILLLKHNRLFLSWRPGTYSSYFLEGLQVILKCHLLREAFPDHSGINRPVSSGHTLLFHLHSTCHYPTHFLALCLYLSPILSSTAGRHADFLTQIPVLEQHLVTSRCSMSAACFLTSIHPVPHTSGDARHLSHIVIHLSSILRSVPSQSYLNASSGHLNESLLHKTV